MAGVARDVARLAGAAHRAASTGWIAAWGTEALDRLDGTADATDDPRRVEVRSTLVALVGTEGADPALRARARHWLDDSTVDAELRAAAIAIVAASATAEEHADLERRWREADTPQDELRYLQALVDTEDPELFDRAVDLAVREVRSQNAPYLLRRAIDHPRLGGRAWATVAQRWDEVTERFPSNSLPRMLEGIRGTTDAAVAGSIEAFMARHPVPAGELQATQHVERMWVTVAAADRVRAAMGRAPGMLGHGPH
jgi:puromycin-sensitive aminopeptidase